MIKSNKIAQHDLKQQPETVTKQLSVTKLNNLAHGEEPHTMRNGFYTRRGRFQL